MRALLVGAVLCGCYREAPAPAPTPHAPIAKPNLAINDPLGFLPVESEVVAVVELRSLRASQLWKRFEPAVLARIKPALDEFKTLCGFDPLVTVRRISVGFRDFGAGKPTGVVVVKGIERDPAMRCMQRMHDGAPTGSAIERGVVTIPADPPIAFTFVDGATLVALIGPGASPAGLGAVIARGTPLRGSPQFGELFGKLQLGDPLWFVLDGKSKLFDNASMLSVFRPRAILGSVNVSNGLAVAARVRLDTADEATNVTAMVQGQLGMAATIFEEIAVSAEAEDMVIQIRMTEEQIQAVLTMVGAALP